MDKTTVPYLRGRFIIFILSLAILQTAAATPDITIHASGTYLAGGSDFEVVIAAETASDFYFAGMEVSWDHSRLELISLSNGSLTGEGISIWGLIDEGRAGVSVSRTEPLEEASHGEIMILLFRVTEQAASGSAVISFHDPEFICSQGSPLVLTGMPCEVVIEVAASVTGAVMMTGAVNQVDEGDLFHVDAVVVVNGIDDGERLLVQIGVNDDPSGPEAWEEGLWTPMIFAGSDDGNMFYISEVAYRRPPGHWYIAMRCSLDGEEFVFGTADGTDGEAGVVTALLEIMPAPPFRHTLSYWDFDGGSLFPASAQPGNRDAELGISGASFTGFTGGYINQAANSGGWSPDGAGWRYWWIEISTSGFSSLEISSRQYGSGTGPRDFLLEYSLDGYTWIALEGGEITVGSNWTSGWLDRLQLPAELEDRDKVLLRWINISDISINGAITGSSGTNRIDEILITGINPAGLQASVWPGDTNNDGVINADDVLPLGRYWLSSGASAIWESTASEPRIVEEWVPPGATYADTNGDGVVDHMDLLAVGLKFGQSVGHTKKHSTPLATIVIDPLTGERTRIILLESPDATAIGGAAFRLEADGIPDDMWKIEEVVPLFAAGVPGDRLLTFTRHCENAFEAAFALKGAGELSTHGAVAAIRLVIDDGWNEAFTISLGRLTLSNDQSPATVADEALLVPAGCISRSEEPGLPAGGKTDLHIYPNPVNENSVISFAIEQPATVRLDITCLQGRMVAVKGGDFFLPGSWTIPFDGSRLLPGIYYCRLMLPGEPPRIVKMIKLP